MKPRAILLTEQQIKWIDKRKFNLSKFIQHKLDEEILKEERK